MRIQNDGISVLRASGVGGGSLVYSNITIEPPDLIFKDPRWGSVSWSPAQRQRYYQLGREAIGRGVLFALDRAENAPKEKQKPAVNTGLSKINTRTAGLYPHWRGGRKGRVQQDPRPSGGNLVRDDDGPDQKNSLLHLPARAVYGGLKPFTPAIMSVCFSHEL